jgi:hypothetical protein
MNEHICHKTKHIHGCMYYNFYFYILDYNGRTLPNILKVQDCEMVLIDSILFGMKIQICKILESWLKISVISYYTKLHSSRIFQKNPNSLFKIEWNSTKKYITLLSF